MPRCRPSDVVLTHRTRRSSSQEILNFRRSKRLSKSSEVEVTSMEVEAFIHWPGAPLTRSLIVRALDRISLLPVIVSAPSSGTQKSMLQWASYDYIDHELTLSDPHHILASSFIIRKALIRKHFLHRCILAYTTKHPESSLNRYFPRTWDIEIAFADELDELWGDELWELAENIKGDDVKWWILKPGMADRGMGIRLFNSKEALQRIFEEFEQMDEAENHDDIDGLTNIVTSQLRHFVIQEYLTDPVLVDPRQSSLNGEVTSVKKLLNGRKFHLRVYCVASGALSVYLYLRILALFASERYSQPSKLHDSSEELDLSPHLTNTCLQGAAGETNVRLLDELVGCTAFSSNDSDYQESITENDIASIKDQIADALSEAFKAALQMPVHFQPLPNAFELYGVDFLVCHSTPSEKSGRFQVKLLEFNSEPAIEMTGERLRWILEDLYELIGKTCVEPFFRVEDKGVKRSCDARSSCGLRKCLEVNLHA